MSIDSNEEERAPQPEREEGDAEASLFARGRELVESSAEQPSGELRFLGMPRVGRRRAPPAGSHPGHMVMPVDAPPPRLRLIAYGPDAIEDTILDEPAALRAHLASPERVVWLDVEGFGDRAVLEQLGEILEIHPLAMADVVNVPQRPKADRYEDRLLLITRMARLTEEGEIDLEQVSIVLGPGFVATFQERPGDVFDPVRARIRLRAGRIRDMREDYLAYALLDAVVDGYFPVVEAMGGVIDALEEEVVEKPTHATLARIHATRRTLLSLHRIQWRQRDAIASLLRDDEFPFTAPVRVYLRDAHDHAIQTVDVIEHQREMAVGLMELYLSSASNRMNEVMKTLTIVATIFIPLTFLAGVYGMNFDRMPELHWRWGYPAAWSVMVALGLGLLLWFRRRGWLGGG